MMEAENEGGNTGYGQMEMNVSSYNRLQKPRNTIDMWASGTVGWSLTVWEAAACSGYLKWSVKERRSMSVKKSTSGQASADSTDCFLFVTSRSRRKVTEL